jgi:hypothetical protein
MKKKEVWLMAYLAALAGCAYQRVLFPKQVAENAANQADFAVRDYFAAFPEEAHK